MFWDTSKTVWSDELNETRKPSASPQLRRPDKLNATQKSRPPAPLYNLTSHVMWPIINMDAAITIKDLPNYTEPNDS